MPDLSELAQLQWPLPGVPRLAWHSPSRRGFILGNHADKCLLPAEPGAAVTPVVTRADPYAVKTAAYDDQLPDADYAELQPRAPDGFHFLSRQQYDQAFAGRQWGSICPVDQALISGLNGPLPVLHPAAGAIVSITDRRFLLHALDGSQFTTIAELKARGPVTALLASPSAPVLYYGTNAGDLFRVPVTPEKLGPQKKLASFERVMNAIRQTPDNGHLLVGGMGYLAIFALAGSSAEMLVKHEISCRSIHVLGEHQLLLNQGLHGLRLCEISGPQLRTMATHTPPAPVDRVICSPEEHRTLVLLHPPAGMTLYELRHDEA